jgi:hypothetical protein
MRRLGFILGLTIVLVFVGCGDDTFTGLRGIAVVSGNGQLAISTSSSVTPTISWTGGNAQRLTITPAGGGAVAWDLEALDAQVGFTGPVSFGQVPNDARERSNEIILTAGTEYRVRVVRVDGVENTRVFTPTPTTGTGTGF